LKGTFRFDSEIFRRLDKSIFACHLTNINMTEEDKILKPLRQATQWLYVGIAIVLLSPILLTRHNFCSRLDFTQTGEIGDTIGGITAPIVNLLGAILVYLALKAQIEANLFLKMQLDDVKIKDNIQQQTDDVNQLYYNLKESIDNFNYVSFDSNEFGIGQYLTGSEAIYKLFNDFYCNKCHLSDDDLKGNPKITELTSILEICDTLITRIGNSSIPSKLVMNTLTCHQFKYRVFPYLSTLHGNFEKHYCHDCNKDHGLPDEMVRLIEKILSCMN
jgi:hypothetical protein